MESRTVSRRILLGASTVLASAGLVARRPAVAATDTLIDTLQAALAQLQPSVAALAQNGLAELTQTVPLLLRLGLSPALLSALTNLQPAILAGGGLKHKGLVRRVRNPAMIKTTNNPHFVPQGQAFGAAEAQSYAPRQVQGGGL